MQCPSVVPRTTASLCPESAGRCVQGRRLGLDLLDNGGHGIRLRDNLFDPLATTGSALSQLAVMVVACEITLRR